jgi:hypothetical protein
MSSKTTSYATSLKNTCSSETSKWGRRFWIRVNQVSGPAQLSARLVTLLVVAEKGGRPELPPSALLVRVMSDPIALAPSRPPAGGRRRGHLAKAGKRAMDIYEFVRSPNCLNTKAVAGMAWRMLSPCDGSPRS